MSAAQFKPAPNMRSTTTLNHNILMAPSELPPGNYLTPLANTTDVAAPTLTNLNRDSGGVMTVRVCRHWVQTLSRLRVL